MMRPVIDWRSLAAMFVVTAGCHSVPAPEHATYRVQSDCTRIARCFNRVQHALDAIQSAASDEWVNLQVGPGDYYEKIYVQSSKLRIIGAGRDVTRIYYDAVAQSAGKYHRHQWGTPGSATLSINATDVTLENLTIENTFDYLVNDALPATDPRKLKHSQGVALLLDRHSDRVFLNHVVLKAYQDTLFANGKRAYVLNSTIAGNVDFIFGNGQLLIEDSVVTSRPRGRVFRPGQIQSSITAPSTPLSQKIGIVLHRSALTREEGVPERSVTLGRPWHPTTTFSDGRYADPSAVGQASFIDCFMEAHINEQHWSSMRGTARDGSKTAVFRPQASRFFESGSSGPGARHVDLGIEWTQALSIDEVYRELFRDWPPLMNRIRH